MQKCTSDYVYKTSRKDDWISAIRKSLTKAQGPQVNSFTRSKTLLLFKNKTYSKEIHVVNSILETFETVIFRSSIQNHHYIPDICSIRRELVTQ